MPRRQASIKVPLRWARTTLTEQRLYVYARVWLLAIGTTAMLFIVAELGSHVGRRSKACDEAMGAVKASVLAPVGLMLAFSYSIAAGHYDRRVQAVIGE